MRTLLVAAGVGQLGLAAASLFLPRILRWHEEIARLTPLTGRIFVVYALYILGTNLCLGAVSVLAPEWLLDRSPLARAVAGYAAAYWGVRLVIQFAWFRAVSPKGRGFALADAAVSVLFAAWTATYGAVVLDLW